MDVNEDTIHMCCKGDEFGFPLSCIQDIKEVSIGPMEQGL